jgi:3',5'-cyclic AMP phosphodiesterase CpdA
VTVQILHLGDPHFGGAADIRQIEALEQMLPELRPDVVAVTGDLSLRARHGEFQRARAFVNHLGRMAPVHVMPGNHDVQWWLRPLIPFAKSAIYAKYRRYFGDDLAPALTVAPGGGRGGGGALLAGALTSHGMAWGSVTWKLRDLAVKGHLPRAQIERVQALFAAAPADLARVLVLHHNVMRGDMSRRMGLARWRQAQRRIVESGAELVLCAHDHQEGAELLDGKVVVSTAGTLSTRSRGHRPGSFNFVTIDAKSVQITFFRWEGAKGKFKPSDTMAFARRPRLQHHDQDAKVPA